jgi:pimeloyl-ACP methyl ester carboxylesterase
MPKKPAVILCALAWLGAAWGGVVPAKQDDPGYKFPISDSYKATVVGTPEDVQKKFDPIPIKRARLTVFPDRKVPEYLWYESELRYAYAFQDKPAPLIFLIAGTGGSYNGQKNEAMGRAFYRAGFHVVSLSSPTLPNFIVSASKTGVPGHAVHDAEDLYRVMERIWDKFRDDIEVTNFFVTGYSLGGFNTAFVTWLDEQRKVFNFKAALLINPPVRLYNSISLLDRMLENIPGGPDNFPAFYDRMVKGISSVYKREDKLEFGEEFLYQVFQEMKPRDEELAALVGLSFRFSSANLAFVSDVMTDYGYIKPANVKLKRNSSPGVYAKVAMRLGFTDYFHQFFYPYYNARLETPISREEMITSMSLESIEDYLHDSDKIYVMHNLNDLILEKDEIDFFPRVFGDRAKIYPSGGHCGNMQYIDNVRHMLRVMGSLPQW